jgi:hypothetical protein
MAQSQQAPKIELKTVAPDRNKLRNELIALYHQYIGDVENAQDIQREAEELIKNARREKKAAQGRMAKLRGVLDEEFPGWDGGFNQGVENR